VHTSRRTREFLSREGARIRLTFLPTYAPWLNRIEATWRLVKAQAGTNAWRDTLAQLTADYQATLTALEARILTPLSCFLSE
jgi:transposase